LSQKQKGPDIAVDVKCLLVALISKRGRMLVHLSAAWAQARMDVIMCSCDKSRASILIINSFLAGKGYSKGEPMVPPLDGASNWKLLAGLIEDAVCLCWHDCSGISLSCHVEDTGTYSSPITWKGQDCYHFHQSMVEYQQQEGQDSHPTRQTSSYCLVSKKEMQ
jgi:hypothetical protein